MSTRNILAAALCLGLSSTLAGVASADVDVEATKRLVRETIASVDMSPSPRTRIATYIAHELNHGRFVAALKKQGVRERSRRERLWKAAVDKQSIGGDSTVRSGRWAVAVVVGEQEHVSHKERLAHELFHGYLAPAKDIPSRFEEGVTEALTRRALGAGFKGSVNYRPARMATEALVSATSFRLVGGAYLGNARDRRALSAAMDRNLAAVRSALAADSQFTGDLVASVSAKGRRHARSIRALQDSRSSAWDLFLALFTADVHSWAKDAARRHAEVKEDPAFDAKDALDYGANMAQSRPYLELAGFLASGDRAFLDQYHRKLRDLGVR